MDSGIYIIKNNVNNKVYIGQSIQLKTREGKHKSYLKHNKHENDYLQRSYNKYGVEAFSFEILERCDIDKLDEREIFYINKFNSMDIEKGYNLESGGNSNKIVSEITREKKRGKNNPMYGKKPSEETIEKMRESARGMNNILTESEVVEVKEMLILGIKQSEIALRFNVHYSTINKIAKFKNWQYLREDLNEKIIASEKLREQKIVDDVIRLKLADYNKTQIKDSTGLTYRRIKKILIENGLW